MKTPMLRGWWSLALAGAAAAALLALAAAWPGQRSALRFRDVRELRAWAERRGLHCRSDWQDGRVTATLALSAHPLSWEDVSRLCPGARGGGAGREETVWAVNCSPGLEELPVPPWNGECRAWGDVLVTGDPELLDRLERGGG
jgi:hypothetical protein